MQNRVLVYGLALLAGTIASGVAIALHVWQPIVYGVGAGVTFGIIRAARPRR